MMEMNKACEVGRVAFSNPARHMRGINGDGVRRGAPYAMPRVLSSPSKEITNPTRLAGADPRVPSTRQQNAASSSLTEAAVRLLAHAGGEGQGRAQTDEKEKEAAGDPCNYPLFARTMTWKHRRNTA